MQAPGARVKIAALEDPVGVQVIVTVFTVDKFLMYINNVGETGREIGVAEVPTVKVCASEKIVPVVARLDRTFCNACVPVVLSVTDMYPEYVAVIAI